MYFYVILFIVYFSGDLQMSRQIINRLLIVVFIVVIASMCFVYAKQERSMKNLNEEYAELTDKSNKLEYLINEYSLLIDNVNSRNYIIRLARERFGWVFDGETIYKKDTSNADQPEKEENDTVIPDEQDEENDVTE